MCSLGCHIIGGEPKPITPFKIPEPAFVNGLAFEGLMVEGERGGREEREIVGADPSLSDSRNDVFNGSVVGESFRDGKGALWETGIGDGGVGGDQNVVREGVSNSRDFLAAASAKSVVLPLGASDDDEALGLGAGDALGDLLGEGRGKSWSSSSSLIGTAATAVESDSRSASTSSLERRRSPEPRLRSTSSTLMHIMPANGDGARSDLA